MTEIPLRPDIEPDILYTNSWFTEDHKPAVYWQLDDRNGLLTIAEARDRAKSLFQAVGYAEGEAAIVKGMIQLHLQADRDQNKGFIPNRKQHLAAVEEQALIMCAQMLEFVRQGRSPLPIGLEVIFGYHTRKGLINVPWYGGAEKWEPMQAIEHAILLIETAEAAESDAYFRWFLMDRLEMDPAEAYPLIAEFQTFRDRRQLEDLFSRDDRTP